MFDDKEWYLGKVQKKSEREQGHKSRFEQTAGETVDKFARVNFMLRTKMIALMMINRSLFSSSVPSHLARWPRFGIPRITRSANPPSVWGKKVMLRVDAKQRNIVPEKQGGVRYTVTTYPTKHLDSHATNHPTSNQRKMTVSPAIHLPFGQHMMVPLSPQPISAIPMPNPIPPMPSTSPIVGTTDLRNSSRIPGAPAQLTIFYNGSVCAYDNVSAEKAQAIMLLAGNGPSTTSNATAPAVPVQTSPSRPSILESFAVSHPYAAATTHRLSPAPETSIGVSQPLAWSIKDMTASKQGSILVSSNKVEPMKVASSPGSVSATFLPSSTVPQFRRKSLARFLEKRKERVINAAPYADIESPECNSSGSCPVPAVN